MESDELLPKVGNPVELGVNSAQASLVAGNPGGQTYAVANSSGAQNRTTKKISSLLRKSSLQILLKFSGLYRNQIVC